MMHWQNFFSWLSRRMHPAADGTEGAPLEHALPVAPLPELINNNLLEDRNLVQNCNEISDIAFAASDSPFDPASVPPIESITADTDIRAFLAPGVPGELACGALRRAWATDPKIRDFVGPADYDWDFNDPGSLPGFGSLEMTTDELRQISAQVFGPFSAAVVPREDLAQSDFAVGHADEELHQNIAPEQEPHRREQNSRAHYEPGHRAAEPPSPAAKKSQLIVRRRQGGALPK
jgi:hypothetical protein